MIVTYIRENRETNADILWQLCRLPSIQLLKVTIHVVTEHEKPYPHTLCLFLKEDF